MQPLNKTTASHPARITERLERYWQEMRGDRDMPFEEEINPEALGDSWNACFLITIRDGIFAYSYLGDALIDAYGDDITGHEIAETLAYPHPESLFRTFQAVATNGVPHTDANEFVNSRGALVKYRSCVVPLGSRNLRGITYLLGAMRWKIY
jgi:hypothetical protein